MDLPDLIRSRRTHKAYDPAPLDRATLDELFELARWAPNHNLTNPWRFRVLGPEALARLKAAAGPEAAAKLDRAPTLVVASALQVGDPVEDEENRDAAAAACYIVLLAAHARGLGGYWWTPGVLRTPEGRAACGVEDGEAVLGLLHLGTAKGDKPRAGARAARRGRHPPGVSSRDRILRAGGRRMRLGGEPLLMGIVNASPDSFSDAGELPDTAARIARAHALAAAGARIVDVGGETARGGLEPVAVAEEIARVEPVVAAVARELDVLVSVDTYKPEVAEAAIAAGAQIVNDVSGLADPRLAELCAGTGAALVLMHTRVPPKGTLLDPEHYDDVVADVRDGLADAIARAEAAGVHPEQLLLDPAPTSPRRRRRPSRSCGGWTCCTTSGGRCCSPSRARTSSARSPGAARASGGRRRSRRSAGPRGRAPTCCGCTTSRRPPTSSPCGPCWPAIASSSRTPD